MIFRRIKAHVEKENWFAVFVDFAIVVFGVFIGLQVANWNEDLADRQRAKNYIERLTEDITINNEILSGRTKSYALQIQYGLSAIEASPPPTTHEDAWVIVRAFFQASHSFSITMQRGAYDEIISSGDLALLRDQDLVNAITEFYSFGGFASIANIPDYRENVRRIIPFHLQQYLQTQCYEIRMPDTHSLIDCPPPDGAENLIELANELKDDDELKRDLQYMLSYAGVSADIARNRANSADLVLEMLSNKSDER